MTDGDATTDSAALRIEISDLGASLHARRLTFGRTGNLSVRVGEEVLVTPTGATLGRLDPEQLARIDLTGAHVAGPRPSKEAFLHAAMYRARPDAGAVVHLHSTYAVAVSCLADVDPRVVAWIRLGFASLAFLPFARWRGVPRGLGWRLPCIGALQYGAMYLAYITAFRYLASHEVAMLTVFTPIYVTALYDVKRRRFHSVFFLAALGAAVGTGFLAYRNGGAAPAARGFVLMQVSNMCFAAGQVWYKTATADRLKRGCAPYVADDICLFAWIYLGAMLLTAGPAAQAVRADGLSLSARQWLTLLYLGIVPSGLAFFLWNAGARRVNSGTLAVMNNAKIPLAVLVSLFIFNESTDGLRLAVGGLALAGAVTLSELWGRRADPLTKTSKGGQHASIKLG